MLKKPIYEELEKRILELEKAESERTLMDEALREKKERYQQLLSGLLPICSHCKKIRDDNGYWQQIEAYLRDHSEAEFSHSICKDCEKKYFPDYDIYCDDQTEG